MPEHFEQLLAPADPIPARPLVPALRLVSAMHPVPANPPLPACPFNSFLISCLARPDDCSTAESGSVPCQPDGVGLGPRGSSFSFDHPCRVQGSLRGGGAPSA